MFFSKPMHAKTLGNISKEMRKIDICMFSTITPDGAIASRPMSNNKDVDYNGDCWFFTSDKQELVDQLSKNSNVTLSYQTKDYLYISIVGTAELIRDKTEMQKHWVPDLERWFDKGVDTPGIVLIAVKGRHLKYWDKMDSGEISL